MLGWLNTVFEKLSPTDRALVPVLDEAESLLGRGRAVEALAAVSDAAPMSKRLRVRWLHVRLRGAFALKDILFLDSLARHAEVLAPLDPDRAADFLREAEAIGALALAQGLANGLDTAGWPVEGVHARLQDRRADRADPGRLLEIAQEYLEGEYQDLRLLAVGHSSFLVSATQQGREERVAIKFMDPHRLPDKRAQERFRREVQLLGRLDHPNILPVLDFELGSHPYLVTPFFRGHDLECLLMLKRPFLAQDVALIGAQLCEAAAHAHSEGVVHRNIKPSKVLLDEELDLRLVDFSLTSQESTWDVTAVGAMVGDWLYIAPEIYDGKPVEDRTKLDVFGIGGTLFRLLTGEPPYRAAGGMFRERTPPPQNMVSSWRFSPMSDAVKRCLAEDPADRPGELFELALTLRKLVE